MREELPVYSGGGLPARITEEEEEKEDSEARRIRIEIAHEVVAGIKEEASAREKCQIDRTKNSRAKCQAKLGLLAYRKRRGVGR